MIRSVQGASGCNKKITSPCCAGKQDSPERVEVAVITAGQVLPHARLCSQTARNQEACYQTLPHGRRRPMSPPHEDSQCNVVRRIAFSTPPGES